MSMNDETYMHEAIAVARRGIAVGQSPFGAVIVRAGRIVAATHNTVWLTTDPTAHAEVNAIRRAAADLKSISLAGCTMYTTCEPCPMCLSAIHWAKLDAVHYGAEIADAQSAGFAELCFPASELAKRGGSPLRVIPGLLRAECAALFAEWQSAGLSKPY